MIWLIASVLGVVMVFAIVSRSSKNEVTFISPGARIIDVRSPREFQAGHHPGAENIPLDNIEKNPSIVGKKSQELIVYCQSGMRSHMAKKLLLRAGYNDVLNGGGLKAMCKMSGRC